MWQTKLFKTATTYQNWMAKNANKYQIREIFVNNYYLGIEYKPLIKIF